MKRALFFVLLLNTVSLCFAEEYYESNILGMMLKEIDSPYDSTAEYILKVTRDEDGTEERILLRDGSEISGTEIRKEENYLFEVTVEEKKTTTVKRENGIIISEKIEKENEAAEETKYNYNGRRLISADYILDDKIVYSDRYFYTDQGRLLNVERDYKEDGKESGISFIFNEGMISRFWSDSDERKNYIMYDQNGIVLNEYFGLDDWNEIREYVNMQDGGRRELITDRNNNYTTRLTFDKNNRLSESLLKDENGHTIERAEWIYRGENLFEYKLRKDLSLEVYNYEWDGEGSLMKETYYKNGNIIQTTDYVNDDDYTELLYRNGRAVLEIKYADGVRIETVQLQE